MAPKTSTFAHPPKRKYPIHYEVTNSFKGYEHKKDITNSDTGILVHGSKNILINDYEKIITRAGFTLKGAAGTLNIPIRSNHDGFVTVRGDKISLRETPTGDPLLRDTIEMWYNGAWVRITPDTNPLTPGIHEYHFAEVWDQDNLQTKLVYVNGLDGSAIHSWNGAIVNISGSTSNTISIAGPEVWSAFGFSDAGQVVIGGIVYTYTGGGNTTTLTGVSPNASALTPGDLAVDMIQADPFIIDGIPLAGFNFDICDSLYNQMYYGDYKNRTMYLSMAYNRPSTSEIITYSATLNDMTIPDTSNYTGVSTHTYRIEIDGVFPAIDAHEQTFNSFQGGSNDANYDYSAYLPIIPGENQYIISIVSNVVLTPAAGTHVGVFIDGETVVGQTSGALGILLPGTNDFAGGAAYVNNFSGAFLTGETILGATSGATVQLFQVLTANTFQFYVNGVLTVPQLQNGGPVTPAYSYTCLFDFLLADGIKITWPQYGSHYVGDTIQLIMNQTPAQPDTFQWQIDQNPPVATGVQIIAGSPQLLSDGLQIQFTNDMGHSIGDYWEIKVVPAVTKFWADGYISEPVRRPGEGDNFLLDSPPVALRPQESSMYINTRAGSWWITSFTQSANLQAETLNLERLKSEPQTQVLHQDLLWSIKNSLVFVSKDKTFDTLGRVELIQTPQSMPISDRVRDDFLSADFTGGSIIFFENKSYITDPVNNITFVFDHILDLWQPPQTFPIAKLAVIDDVVCGHSSQTNETYTLFDGSDDNGQPIEAVALFSYENYGTRANLKSFNEFYIEGYITSNTILDYMIRYEIDGCGDATFGEISGSDGQIVCIGGEDRSLGKKSLGVFSLASLNTLNSGVPFPKFRVIKTMPRYNFFEVQYGFSSYGSDQKWALLAYGPGAAEADERNNYIKQ